MVSGALHTGGQAASATPGVQASPRLAHTYVCTYASVMTSKHKTVKHVHQAGDFHELTFSCYQRRPLLINDEWRRMFCRSVQNALLSQSFRLAAFVLMPEHVHLLVWPESDGRSVSRFLAAVKRPFSYRIKQWLQQRPRFRDQLTALTIRERPGKSAFRFWQEGSGYDRNLNQPGSVLSAIDYIHLNPVRRGLVDRATDWKWSSAAWFESDGRVVDPDLPELTPIPHAFTDE